MKPVAQLVERKPALLSETPKRWATQAEAIKHIESLTCDQIREIAHEFTRG